MNSTCANALPLVLNSTAKRSVLLLHGWTGLPAEMRYLGERLAAAGFAVHVPRLPGHGTWREDFLKTTRRDWMRRARDEYLDMKAVYQNVFIAGLSMGGLLALLLAAEFKVSRIALAAPAIVNTNRRILLTPLLRHFVSDYPRRDWTFEGEPEFEDVARRYWSRTWVGPAAELHALQRQAARALPRVRADTLIIVSTADTTVPVRAADIIERRIGASCTRRITLRRSQHVVVNDCERGETAERIIDWFTA